MQAGHQDLLHEELPPYLTNLGLLNEPFADTPSGHFFYIGTDSEQRLDLMHHLAPYSPLLVVIGEPGIGKTALLQQFTARAKDNWRTIVVTARPDMDRDDFMGVIGEALGMSLQSQVDPRAQYLALTAQLRALRQTAQIPILLIDDAENLSAPLLELIQKLCAENDDGHMISVILFGTPQLQALWSQQPFSALGARVTHTFEVPPYTEEETARYIRHRLRAAGGSDDGPFDSVTINKIHAASGGIPSRINVLAHEVLVDRTMVVKQTQGKDNPGVTSGSHWGRRITLVAGVIVVALLVAGPLRSILFNGSTVSTSELLQTKPLPLPSSSAPAKGDDTEERVIRSDQAASNPAPASPSSAAQSPTAKGESGAGSEMVKTIPLPPVDTTIVKEPVPAENSAPAPQAPPPASAPVSPPVQVSSAESTPPPVTKKAAPPKKESKNKEMPAAKRGAQDWLTRQPPGNYTLQLMATKDEGTVRRFIEQNHLQDKAGHFPVSKNGQTLYALVYGSFPQRSGAVQAAKSLPKSWGISTPWIRSFKSLPAFNP